MIGRLLATVAISALILSGIAAPSVVASQAQPAQTPAQTEQPQTRTTTGKITAVSGQAFAIEVGQGDSKRTMEFVTDSTTSTSGQLKVGSTATVQYRSAADGKNMATKVDIQG